MTTLQDDIEVLRMQAESSPFYIGKRAALDRAIVIMTALAKLDAEQAETAIEYLSSTAAVFEQEAAVGENESGWAAEAATYRALAEALEACR